MWSKRTGWRVLTRNIFTSGLNPHVKIYPIAREGLRFAAYQTIAKMYKVELRACKIMRHCHSERRLDFVRNLSLNVEKKQTLHAVSPPFRVTGE